MKWLNILGLFLVLTIVGCVNKIESPEQTAFLAQDKIGAYVDGAVTFAYDESLHQLAYDPVSMQYTRIQSDDQTKYMQVSFREKPGSGVGQSVTIEVLSRGVSVAEGSYDVVVKKRNDEMVWLWSNDKSIGFIVK